MSENKNVILQFTEQMHRYLSLKINQDLINNPDFKRTLLDSVTDAMMLTDLYNKEMSDYNAITFGDVDNEDEDEDDYPCAYRVFIRDGEFGEIRYIYYLNAGNDFTVDQFLKLAKQANPNLTENAVITTITDEKLTFHKGEMSNVIYP